MSCLPLTAKKIFYEALHLGSTCLIRFWSGCSYTNILARFVAQAMGKKLIL